VRAVRQGLLAWLVRRWNLRFPGLFVIFAGLALLDMLVPDFIPFADEIGLALLAAMFGLWRKRRTSGTAPVE
jgi:hypothetical protein